MISKTQIFDIINIILSEINLNSAHAAFYNNHRETNDGIIVRIYYIRKNKSTYATMLFSWELISKYAFEYGRLDICRLLGYSDDDG